MGKIEVMMAQFRKFPIHAEVGNKHAGGQHRPVPIGSAVIGVERIKQVPICMGIVTAHDNRIGAVFTGLAILYCPYCLKPALLFINMLDLYSVFYLYTQFTTEFHQPLNDGIHTAHREIDPIGKVQIGNERIEGRRISWTGTQKDHGIFQNLPGANIGKITPYIGIEGLKNVQPEALSHKTPIKKLKDMAIFPVQEILHGRIILILSVSNVGFKFFRPTLLELLKNILNLFKIAGDLDRFVTFKMHRIMDAELFKVIVGTAVLTKESEILVKDLRHKVPGGSHIKGKAILFPEPGSAAGGITFFKDTNRKSFLSKEGCGGQSREARTNNENLLFQKHIRFNTTGSSLKGLPCP